MGGKRPDQYNIAPGEAGASDYKTLPEVAHGRGAAGDPTLRDKQHLSSNVGGGGSGQHFFDAEHPQPSHDANVHASEGHRGHEGHAHHGTADDMRAESPSERLDEGMEDPRDRGVGA